MPYLHDLGDRWERGELSVAREHFASSVLRGRLLGLARGWGRGAGPRALLPCPGGEIHPWSSSARSGERVAARAARHRVAIAGVGATKTSVEGVERLSDDPVTEAERADGVRIWDVDVRLLCDRHVLGEHRELRAIWTEQTEGKRGYGRHPETLRWRGRLAALYERHESRVAEMARRGFRHVSPLDRAYATGASTWTRSRCSSIG